MPDASLLFRTFNEIGIIAQLAQTRFEAVMPNGMTLAQFTVLNHLVRLGGPKSPLALANAFQVTKATMSSTLTRMAAKELISVIPNPKDARGKLVDVTDAGRAIRETCIKAIEPDLKRWSVDLKTSGLENLAGQLATLRLYLDQDRAKRTI
jgi:DNA-binding MarR family transcriptional regulator